LKNSIGGCTPLLPKPRADAFVPLDHPLDAGRELRVVTEGEEAEVGRHEKGVGRAEC
jgi:hypothetical protein